MGPEALRRHAVRQRSRGCYFDPRECGRSAQDLVSGWDCFSSHVGLVLGFCVIYCKLVARPKQTTLDDVRALYDRQHGRLADGTKAAIIGRCDELSRCQSLVGILEILQPHDFVAGRLDKVCELILWAEKYGRRREMDAIKADLWLNLQAGACPLFCKWQREVGSYST